jgi:uncharacterized membrane protein
MKYFFGIAIMIAIVWGCTPFLVKRILQNIHYKTLIFIELFLTFTVSSLFCLYNRSEITNDVKNIDSFTLCVAAILVIAVLCVNILHYNVINEHETYLVASITSVYPIIALFLSCIFLNEKITIYKIFGVFLVVIGIICIIK